MNIGEALGVAAKGAAAGMALGPIGAIAGGVGGLVLDLAPELGKWLFGEATGKTLAEVTQAVETVTGTSDAVAATQAIREDPQLKLQLRVQLAKIAADRQAEEDAAKNAELQAYLGDVANARSAYATTRDATTPRLAYLTTAATYLSTCGFVLALVFAKGIPDSAIAVISVVIGHLWTVYANVNGFYFGSSSSSERKTEILTGQLHKPTTTTTIDSPPAPPTTVTTTTGPSPPDGGDAPVAPGPFPHPPAARPLAFEEAFAGVIGVEGGYSSGENDPGGPTKYGISQRAYPSLDIKTLTLEQAQDIYRKDYWAPLQPDNLPAQLAYEMFDFAVNSGCGRAVRCMQRLVAATEDGVVGPHTLARIAAVTAEKGATTLASEYMAERLRFLRSLPTWDRFGRGWAARLETVEHNAGLT
jgi:hypothetical protein